MGQHFLYHSDLIPATAVHHAVYANFTNDIQPDLILCGPNWLKVYRIEPYTAESQHEGQSCRQSCSAEEDQIPPQNGNIFHLMDSFSLAGVAETLHTLTFDLSLLKPVNLADCPRKERKRRKKQAEESNYPDARSDANQGISFQSPTSIKSGKHVLLLTFALYKWVMIGYDRKTNSLVTLGLFTFEENAVGFGATLQGEKEGREQLLGSSVRPLVRIDTQVRCGAMLVYLDQIVIVPFRDSRVMDLAFLSEDEEDEQYASSEGKYKRIEKNIGADASAYSNDNTSPCESANTDVEDDEDDLPDRRNAYSKHFKSERQESTKQERNGVPDKLEFSLDKSVKLGMKRSIHGGSNVQRGSSADSGSLLVPGGMKDLPYNLTGREFLLRLRELDIKGRVADFAFLEGYLEPTLMILHEENDRIASSGRFAIGYDTMCLTVLSITLNSRLHPVIWCVKNLPADCFRIIPCKVPIGGALLLSTNAILYFNQTQFYGIKLNVFADKTVNQSLFPCQDATYEVLEPLPDEAGSAAQTCLAFVEKPLSILLYDCHYDYLGSGDILLSLPDDTLYVLKMPQTSSRVLSAEEYNHTGRFILRKVASPASTASCVLVNRDNDSIFIGSRCGDSVLYKIHRQTINKRKTLLGTVVMSDGSISQNSNVEKEDTDMEAVLEEKLLALGSQMALDAADEDDAFLYGPTLSQEPTSGALPSTDCFSYESMKEDDHSLHLQAVDYIPGIGQITSMDLGVQSNADSNEQHEELVVSGGSSKDGSISVIHHGLRPIVSTAAELSGCRAMWTVVGMNTDVHNSEATRRYDSYLILSVAQRTMILRTGEEMEPLENDSGFYTCGPTLCATNLFSQRRIVQVYKQGVRVMQQAPIPTSETKESDEEARNEPLCRLVCTQEIPFAGEIESGGMNFDTTNVGIVSVDTIDPYILLLLTDGSIRLLEGDADLELTVLEPTVSYDDCNPLGVRHTKDDNKHAIGISAACLFYDWAGMFDEDTWHVEDSDEQSPAHTPQKEGEDSHYFEVKDDTDGGTEEEDDEMAELYQTKTENLPNCESVSYEKESKTLHGGKSLSIPLRKQQDAKLMCGLCYGDGSLHIYSVPDFTKMGIFPYVTFAPKCLVNTMATECQRNFDGYSAKARHQISSNGPRLGFSSLPAESNEGRIRKAHAINSPVADIAIHRIGPSEGQHNSQLFSQMVLLVFLANGDLIMYKVLPFSANTRDSTRCSFHFVRVNENLITRPNLPVKAIKDHGNVGTHDENSLGSTEASTSAIIAKLRANFRYPMLTRFFNVNNNSGVFFRGAYPVWILPSQGQPVFVPFNIASVPSDQTRSSRFKVPVLSFTPFHHWNCPNGFVYFHSSGSLRVCELPSSQNFTLLPSGNGFVLQKVRFGATIHHLLYLGRHGPGGVAEALKSPTFAMVLSRKVTLSEAEQAYWSENNDENTGDDMYQNGGGKDLEEGDDPNAEALLNSNVMAPTAEKFPDLDVNEMPLTEEDAYELRVVQLDEYGDWAGQGVFRAYFERHEVVLSVKILYLHDASLLKKNVDSTTDEYHRRNVETDTSANEEAEWNRRKRPYIVIGTGYVGPNGEDASGKGRLLLYELDYAQYVDKDGTTSSKLPKLRLTFIKEHHQGAVTSVIQLGMYVLASVGSKMIVYEFKSDQLIGCAFYDAQMFITSLSVLRKEYVMYSDVYKSVSLLRWRQKDRQLLLLAKDYEPLAVTTAEFNILDTRLALLAADVEENLHVLQYAPHDIESRGGQRLLRTSDFHVGVQISSIFRKLVYSNASHQQFIPTKSRCFGNMYLNVLGSSEGGIAALIPVAERVFRRLFTLQNVMISALPQNCALNPREFRVMKANGRVRSGRPDAWCKQKWKKGFLDGQVLCRFLHLDYVAQKELARCIGTNPEIIIQNLSELQRNTMSFL
ncbi:unnamed protein product [Albugo candida]|uniref:Cleavage and polyadenylation specificity factor subunit 1 n=1 Tax=Albugo candida TaxID=65357 RepID=A0A024G3L5_9STRA|nr:unnamed protein product [Albugo candida]|eukprot:CCI41418.1 unnamed protein product [Albugo candida]